MLAIKYCHHVNRGWAPTTLDSLNATKLPKKTALPSQLVSLQLEIFDRTANRVLSNDPLWQNKAFKAQFLFVLELLNPSKKKKKLESPCSASLNYSILSDNRLNIKNFELDLLIIFIFVSL